MQKLLLAKVAGVALVATAPAVATDGQGYVAIEGGVLFPKDPDGGTVFVDYSATQTPATPLAPIPADATFDVFDNLNAKTGFDIDIIGGYDFGMFRLEGEIAYKSSKIKADFDQATIDVIVNPLNSLGILDGDDFDTDNKVNVWSGMLNGLLDFGGQDGSVGGYIGAGIGYANVHALDTSNGRCCLATPGGPLLSGQRKRGYWPQGPIFRDR